MRLSWVLGWVGCAPSPGMTVLSATEEDRVPRSAAIDGRDGGTSGLAFGRSVWTYGDTVLTLDDERGTNWHTNSFDHADPADWRDGFETPVDPLGAPSLVIDLTEDEWATNDPKWALWPSQPLMGPDDAQAWFLYGLYHDGHVGGIGIASWEGLDRPVVRRDLGGTWLLFPEPEIEWANAPVVDGGFVYTFGCPLRGFARPCSLARVPFDRVDVRAAWTFWDGDGWAADADAAARLFDGAPIMACGYVPAIERWLVVYSGPLSERVVARTARALTGPWSKEVELFTVDGPSPYDAVHHPELMEDDGGTQWITYSQPTGVGWFGAEHHLWRVELAP